MTRNQIIDALIKGCATTVDRTTEPIIAIVRGPRDTVSTAAVIILGAVVSIITAGASRFVLPRRWAGVAPLALIVRIGVGLTVASPPD